MSLNSNPDEHSDNANRADDEHSSNDGVVSTELSGQSSGIGSRDSSSSEKHEKISSDSERTVISQSPPIEVLAASTIEHQGKAEYGSFSQGELLIEGTKLAHFVVTKYIGGGGMGRVYLGVDTALDRKVALKVLPVQKTHDGTSVARFMNEAKSAARLNYEHIAQVYFAGEHNGIPFIAFEYVQGTNIRTYVEEHGVLPLPQAINYLLQISHALAHAATHQVIHRDVKPSNILITTGDRAKLIDMGLARLLSHANVDNDLTASGVTLGTFDYISPEQARDPRDADTRSDIYSLGCTFFYMLTGRPPFSDGTVLQKLLQHQGDTPPDVRDFQPYIPVQVSQIIQKMMAKDPRFRYQTASELVDDLTEAAKMIGLRQVDSGSLIWQLPLKGRLQPILRHLPWVVPIVLFAIVVMLVQSGYFFGERTATISPFNDPSPRPPAPPPSGHGTINGNGGTINPDDGLVTPQLTLQYRTLISTLPVSDNNGTTGISAAIPVQPTDIGAALKPESQSSRIPVVPVMAYSYRTNGATNGSTAQKNGGSSLTPPDNQPQKKLIVDPTGWTPNCFLTLKDAASAAAREATIELHFDGPIDIEHFRFAGSKTTIKSGEGYHPKIVFRPPPTVKRTETYSMAALTNSAMVFDSIEIEMVIPPILDVFADRWTMFDLIGVNTVEFRNVVLTFNSAQREQVVQEKNAFFRSCPVPASITVPPPVASRASLTMKNCLVRGEASFLRCDHSRTMQIESENVLIATNQPVFSLLDIKPTDTPNRITANFRHNTIFAPALVSWQQGTVVGTLGHPIALSLFDSVVQFNRNPGTLADYAGGIPMLLDISSFYERKSIKTFYQSFEREWVIRPLQSGESQREDYPAEFREPQKRQFYFDTVVWENPFIDKVPVHNLSKNNFLLAEDSSYNNALNSATDGIHAGVDPKEIPDTYDFLR